MKDKAQWFLIARLSAMEILDTMVALNILSPDDKWATWNDLKANYSDVLLPTGAKLFRDRDGNMGIYGYAYDGSDVEMYLKFKLEV